MINIICSNINEKNATLPGSYLVLISVRVCADPKNTVWLESSNKMKNPIM
jgi:hypothetical protein